MSEKEIRSINGMPLKDAEGRQNLENYMKKIDGQIGNLVANSTTTEGNAELIDARVDSKGTVYTSLGENLRKIDKYIEYPSNYNRLTSFNYVKNGWWNNNGEILDNNSSDANIMNQYVSVENGKYYRLSGGGVTYFSTIRGYDSNFNVLTNDCYTIQSNKCIVLINSENCKYIRFGVKNTTVIEELVLQEGSNITAIPNPTFKNIEIPTIYQEKLNDNSNYLDYIYTKEKQQIYTLGELYYELSNKNLYFKIKSGKLILRCGYANDYDNTALLNMFSEEYKGTSPKGISDCIIIPDCKVLVLDLKNASQRLNIIGREEVQKHHIILLSVLNNNLISGVLVDYLKHKEYDDFIKKLNIEKLNDNSNYLDYIYTKEKQQIYTSGELYYELSNKNLYFKIKSGNLILRCGYANDYNNTALLNMFSEEYKGTSPKGISDCIIIPDGKVFVLDLKNASQRLNIIGREEVQKHHIILLSVLNNNLISGVLVDYLKHKEYDDFIKKLDANIDTLPDYVNTEIERVSNEILSKQNENSLSICFNTDTHYYDDSSHQGWIRSLKALNKIQTQANIPLTVFGGDNTTDRNNKELKFASMKGFIRNINNAKIGTYYILKGNHDDGTLNGNYKINDVEIYVRTNKFVKNFVEDVNNLKGNYGYIDYEKNKIRVICLNSIDVNENASGQTYFAFSNQQLNFVANALKVESDWRIIVFTHVAIKNFETNDFTGTANFDIMWEILKAFKNKTSYTSNGSNSINGYSYPYDINVDYSSLSNNNIVVINGHTHVDASRVYDNILCISTISSASNDYGIGPGDDNVTYSKENGTITETAYDIFTFDKDKIYATRYGAGISREFNWN